MRCIFGAFLIVVACLSSEPLGAAENVDPPFVLPVTDMQQIIPNDDGMAFFYGNWRGLNSGTVRAMSVSPDAFIVWGSDSYPYRVLYEAKNYVLVAELLRPYPKKNPILPGQTSWSLRCPIRTETAPIPSTPICAIITATTAAWTVETTRFPGPESGC
jgi:hypothetical protein